MTGTKLQAEGDQPLRRNRDFRLLWIGSAISTLGSRVSGIAYPLLVLALTGSPANAGVVGFAGTLPYLLLQLPAGALVDRWNRKTVMVVCDVGRGLAIGSLIVSLFAGSLGLVQIIIVAFVEGSLTVFYSLAEPAAVRHIVRPAQLPAALGQIEARDRGAALAGQPLGGFLFGLGFWIPFAADMLSYLASMAGLLLIRTRFQSRADRYPREGQMISDIVTGLVWLWRQPVLRDTTVVVAGSNLLFQAVVLMVIVAARDLGASPAMVGLVLAGSGAGGVLGALAAPFVQRRLSMTRVVIGVNWVWALLMPVLALAPDPLLLGITLGFMAFVGPIWNVAISVYELTITPDELLGRVRSVGGVVAWGVMPLGSLLGGYLLDYFGTSPTAIVLAVLMLLIAIGATLSPAIRKAGRAPLRTVPDP